MIPPSERIHGPSSDPQTLTLHLSFHPVSTYYLLVCKSSELDLIVVLFPPTRFSSLCRDNSRDAWRISLDAACPRCPRDWRLIHRGRGRAPRRLQTEEWARTHARQRHEQAGEERPHRHEGQDHPQLRESRAPLGPTETATSQESDEEAASYTRSWWSARWPTSFLLPFWTSGTLFSAKIARLAIPNNE